MIALTFALAAGLALSFWLIVALLRHPARAFALVAALLAWTVIGPWAFWAILGLTVLGARSRRRCGARRRPLTRRRAPIGISRRPRGLQPAGQLVPTGAMSWA